jgi:hypothetical protein
VSGLCPNAPPGGEGRWRDIGDIPPEIPTFSGEEPASRTFVAARPFGAGNVLIYAHDGLTRDEEITPDSDNIVFADNALRWLIPSAEPRPGCPAKTTIVLSQGSHVRMPQLQAVSHLIAQRGWELKVTSAQTLAADLPCAAVLWYLSDWGAPDDFAEKQAPLIEDFVNQGGGLLVGGLGWSYAMYVPGRPYAVNQLGERFGFAFTTDSFVFDPKKLIRLLQTNTSPPAPSDLAR